MHVVFDLDGTLVDSVGVCTSILNGMLAERGSDRRLSTSEVGGFVSIGGTAMVSGLLGDDCGDPEMEIRAFRELYSSLPTPPGSLYAGAAEALAALREAGASLTICSNKPQPLCEKVLTDLDLARHFDAIVGSAPGLPRKPDPAILHHTLKDAAAGLDRCCLVGDAGPDYQLARRAGIPFILMTHGYGSDECASREVVRCDRFSDLPPLALAALGREAPAESHASR
jgi:phosphoglycolate phosphatase